MPSWPCVAVNGHRPLALAAPCWAWAEAPLPSSTGHVRSSLRPRGQGPGSWPAPGHSACPSALFHRSLPADSRTRRSTCRPRWGPWTRRRRRGRPAGSPARPGARPSASRRRVSTAWARPGPWGCRPSALPRRWVARVGLGWAPTGPPLTCCPRRRSGGRRPCSPTCWSRCCSGKGGAGTSATRTLTCTRGRQRSSSFRPRPSPGQVRTGPGLWVVRPRATLRLPSQP